MATSAYQVEGANYNNQWFAWEAAGRIRSGHCCGRACDWWNDWERDFDLASLVGVNALRLSVEWSRIEPRPGEWDETAVQRYRRMLQGLHRRGIRPFITLHHFTHPTWFERRNAFLNPESATLFERFARRCVQALGDLCTDWVTFNEPNVYSAMGYALGLFPPGRTGDILGAIRCLGNMALAHAHAYRAIHELQPGAQVGWAHNYLAFQPANPQSPFDRGVVWVEDQLFNQTFLGMIRDGSLPFPLNLIMPELTCVPDTCDFVGLNVYSRFHVAFDPLNGQQFGGRMFVPPDAPQGDAESDLPYGEAYPPVVTSAINAAQSLRKPIYILENGVPDARDRIRPWLLVNSLRELHSAIAAGADVRGYFHWTLTDNFEWTEGWKLRFGLFELDLATQRRTMRHSARIYSQIVKQNAVSAEFLAKYGQWERG